MRPRTTIHSYRHSGVGRRGTRTLASFRQPCGGPAAVGSSRLLPQRAVCCRAGRLRSPHTGAPMFDSSACACRPGVGPTAAPCGHALMGTCSYKAEQLRGMTAWSRGRRVSAGGPHLRHWVERCVRGRPRSLHTAAPMLVAARAQAGPPQGPWRRIKPGRQAAAPMPVGCMRYKHTRPSPGGAGPAPSARAAHASQIYTRREVAAARAPAAAPGGILHAEPKPAGEMMKR